MSTLLEREAAIVLPDLRSDNPDFQTTAKHLRDLQSEISRARNRINWIVGILVFIAFLPEILHRLMPERLTQLAKFIPGLDMSEPMHALMFLAGCSIVLVFGLTRNRYLRSREDLIKLYLQSLDAISPAKK